MGSLLRNSLYLTVGLLLVFSHTGYTQSCYKCDGEDCVDIDIDNAEIEVCVGSTTTTVTTSSSTTTQITTPSSTTGAGTTPSSTTQEVTTPSSTTQEVTTPSSTTEEITTSSSTTEEITTSSSTTEEITTPSSTTEEITTEEVTTEEVPSSPEVPEGKYNVINPKFWKRGLKAAEDDLFRCYKILYTDDSVKKAKRGCVQLKEENDSKDTLCDRAFPGVESDNCYLCQDDLCNPAARAVKSIALILAPFVVMLLR